MMKRLPIFITGLFLLILAGSFLSAEEKVYYDVVQKIMEFEFNNSDVMENSDWLCNVFGPRNFKTPTYRKSAEWVKDKLIGYGLTNARLEPYEFGNGWDIDYVSVHMVAPQYWPIIAYPALWSSGTDGKVRAQVIHIDFDSITSEKELEQYRGKLKDRIVFIKPIQKISPHFEALPVTWTKERLDERGKIPIAPRTTEEHRRYRSEAESHLRQKIIDFVFEEGAVAIAHPDGEHYYGTVAGNERYHEIERLWDVNAPPQPTEIVLAVEHYNRIMHILEKDIPVEMEIEVRTTVYKGDPHDHNVVAEIPGTDLAHEIVICGAHLQSLPIGTGAIDNVAGVVVAMEAMRILKAIGVKPRRTIRVGLWGGHDGGGLSGSRSHVRKHFADPVKKEYKKDYDNCCAYFNLDIGPGKIRGVSIMGNEELRAIMTEWIKPLRNIGMAHLFTSGMVHEAYTEVGLIGFYFNHDRKEIDDFNAHTNMDVYERLFPEGMMQSSVVLAALVYHAAMRDEKLPRVWSLPWPKSKEFSTPIEKK
jgi:carboxypeptidase Q